jgi:hypothetical protein
MRKPRIVARAGIPLACCLALAAAGCGSSVESTETSDARLAPRGATKTAAVTTAASGAAMAARKQAADAGKYLFAFFWKTEDENTAAMRGVFDRAMSQVAQRADAVTVNITDPAEQAIVDEYRLERAPMPLVLAIAPNGAITGGFPAKFEEKELLDAFVTPRTQDCMKLLQDGKLVFLCIQNEKTGSNDAALQGVRDFRKDPKFSSATEIVMLDPSDKAEASFLTDLQVSPETKDAVTVFLAPPGAPLAMFQGATSKEQLVATLQKASSACGPGGCGPGGCGPR